MLFLPDIQTYDSQDRVEEKNGRRMGSPSKVTHGREGGRREKANAKYKCKVHSYMAEQMTVGKAS
jgi:hypothetical protein